MNALSAGKPPVLVLHATAGSGHTRAAQAIAAALKLVGHEPRVVDTLDCTNALFRRMYIHAYIELVQRAPALWGYLFEKTDVVHATGSKKARARLAFNKLNARAFEQMIHDAAPSAIICTHFLPLELLSDLKRRGKIFIPVHALITDVSPHAYWIHEYIDHTYVATESGARELAQKGVDPRRISVTGIAVDPVFAERTPEAKARKQLGLPERPTVLLASGGFGVGPLLSLLNSFKTSRAEISLVVVAGKNAELREACEKTAAQLPVPVKVYGFVNNMHELMDAADLIVTKPGGLTTTEILAKGKPMALIAPIPGQEQRNCEYLLEEGAAVRLYDPADAAFYLEKWLADETRMKRMRASARLLAKPQAALDIARAVLASAATR